MHTDKVSTSLGCSSIQLSDRDEVTSRGEVWGVLQQGEGKYIRKQTQKEVLNTVPSICDLLTEEQTFKNSPRDGLEYLSKVLQILYMKLYKKS